VVVWGGEPTRRSSVLELVGVLNVPHTLIVVLTYRRYNFYPVFSVVSRWGRADPVVVPVRFWREPASRRVARASAHPPTNPQTARTGLAAAAEDLSHDGSLSGTDDVEAQPERNRNVCGVEGDELDGIRQTFRGREMDCVGKPDGLSAS